MHTGAGHFANTPNPSLTIFFNIPVARRQESYSCRIAVMAGRFAAVSQPSTKLGTSPPALVIGSRNPNPFSACSCHLALAATVVARRSQQRMQFDDKLTAR